MDRSTVSQALLSVHIFLGHLVPFTIKRGHRIMVQIQSIWFPLVAQSTEVHANYKLGTDADFQNATERVYHSAAYPSRVVLQVLKG